MGVRVERSSICSHLLENLEGRFLKSCCEFQTGKREYFPQLALHRDTCCPQAEKAILKKAAADLLLWVMLAGVLGAAVNDKKRSVVILCRVRPIGYIAMANKGNMAVCMECPRQSDGCPA